MPPPWQSPPECRALVGFEIVHDDDVIAPERREEALFDIGEEHVPGHCAFHHHGCGHLVVAQSGHEGDGLPSSMRHAADRPHAARSAPAQGLRKTADDGSPSISTTQCGEMKARQTAKIREIGDALRLAGYVGLDAQAAVLGLSRSTAWSILQASHKTSGLTASVINRMLD